MITLELIMKFDDYLASKGLSFEAVVIGGAALRLLNVISRETVDCDILNPKIPHKIMEASIEFARGRTDIKSGDNPRTNWLNNGPDSLINYLPKGWEKRLQAIYKGKAIHFKTLGRQDFISTKLLAYCDRERDRLDLIDLKVTKSELVRSIEWVQNYDTNPGWPNHVLEKFKELSRDLGYEF